MIVLRPTPDFVDLAAWRRELEWLRGQPDTLFGKAGSIDAAEAIIEALEQRAQKSAASAP